MAGYIAATYTNPHTWAYSQSLCHMRSMQATMRALLGINLPRHLDGWMDTWLVFFCISCSCFFILHMECGGLFNHPNVRAYCMGGLNSFHSFLVLLHSLSEKLVNVKYLAMEDSFADIEFIVKLLIHLNTTVSA